MSEEISAEIAVKCSGITKVFGSVVANDGILTGTLNGLILQRLWKSPLRKYSIKR